VSYRTILLTGATGKFGKIFTRHFLELDHVVIAVGRSLQGFEVLLSDNRPHEERIYFIEVDLTEETAAQVISKKLAEQNLFPDTLINNARNLNHLRVEEDGLVKRSNFLAEYSLDVVAPYEITMALAMARDSQLRTVVNIGSQYGSVAVNSNLYGNSSQPLGLHYGVAKAALEQLTRELAVRLADRGIRVNCVAFGGVEGRVNEDFKKRYAFLCPSRRMLHEDEVVGPVELLLSPRCSAITGHVLVADGGWTAW
jgi:NAD(P)-dependent dehydrogenase (short-subunit alcohol dehydrogenase family)